MATDLIQRKAHPAAFRFRAVMALTVLLALVVLTLESAVFQSPTSAQTDSGWSTWSPAEGGTKGLQEIADHVAPNYKSASGDQIVTATGGSLTVAGLPARIAVRNADGNGKIEIVSGDGALFSLCGLGPNCSIPTGKPSVERMLLLRRQALELALYAFKGNDSLKNVVVMMPPRPGTRTVKLNDGKTVVAGNQGTAMLFQRDKLRSQLDQPLSRTLPQQVPTVAGVKASPEMAAVASITEPTMYLGSVVQGQDGSAYIVLDPLT
jgi:hypothetical protein